MADLQEINMTKATDMNNKKVRLVGDDGKGYWMEKEDLAKVVGGLLNVFQINRIYWRNTTGKQAREFLYMKGPKIREFIISVARVEGDYWGCFFVFCGGTSGNTYSMQVKTISHKNNFIRFYYKDGHYYIDVNQTYVVCSIVETNYYPFNDKILIQQIETVLPEDATEATYI